jgi:hypothetical protein
MLCKFKLIQDEVNELKSNYLNLFSNIISMEDSNETVWYVWDIEVAVETAAIPEEDVEKYLREEKEKEGQEEKEEEGWWGRGSRRSFQSFR